MDKKELMTRLFLSTPDSQIIGSNIFQLQMNNYRETKSNMLFVLDLDAHRPFYYCQSGIPKSVYYDRLGVYGKVYSELFESLIAPALRQKLEDFHMAGNVYMIVDDSKEIGIIFQSVETCCVQPLVFAEEIDRLVQHIYEEHFPRGTGRYCNTTALSETVSGVEGIREGYLQTEALKAASFFRMTPGVLTAERLHNLQNGATYRDVMNLARALCRAAAQGDDALMLALAERLFLDLLKHSYNMELVRDALSYIKQFLAIRLSVHLPEDDADLDALCSPSSYIIIEECCEAILPVLTRLCCAVKRSGAWSDAVAYAAYFLRSNLGKDVSLPEIAAFADTTPAYLSNLFHQQTGMTIKQYQQKIRMEQACRLLETTGDKVTDIAAGTGFTDRRYFTKTFRETCGMTPQEYRQAKKT